MNQKIEEMTGMMVVCQVCGETIDDAGEQALGNCCSDQWVNARINDSYF
jgi:hypothetical protein